MTAKAAALCKDLVTHADTLDGVSALQSMCADDFQMGQTGPEMADSTSRLQTQSHKQCAHLVRF